MIRRIEEAVPLRLAQSWDNVGFLIGDDEAGVKKMMLTIDITKAVLAEAIAAKVDFILSYHPIIWDGLKSITAQGPEAVVYELIRTGITVFSVHTSLDVAEGGINDGLAEIVGIKNPQPIGDYVTDPAADLYKLIVFIPTDAVNKVSAAVFAAGAGAIGNYSDCGFKTAGEGTFLPLEGSHPAIGKKGKVETVKEYRFETVVPAARLGNVLNAMKTSHPYETPAYDVIKLSNPRIPIGLGRMGDLKAPTPLNNIVQRIKKVTGAKAIGIVGERNYKIRRAAVCAGSCGKIINSIIAGGCDLYLTGELKHHQALAAAEAGLTCICLSHTVSERFYLKKLAKQMQTNLPEIAIIISKKDKDPFQWMSI